MFLTTFSLNKTFVGKRPGKIYERKQYKYKKIADLCTKKGFTACAFSVEVGVGTSPPNQNVNLSISGEGGETLSASYAPVEE